MSFVQLFHPPTSAPSLGMKHQGTVVHLLRLLSGRPAWSETSAFNCNYNKAAGLFLLFFIIF